MTNNLVSNTFRRHRSSKQVTRSGRAHCARCRNSRWPLAVGLWAIASAVGAGVVIGVDAFLPQPADVGIGTVPAPVRAQFLQHASVQQETPAGQRQPLYLLRSTLTALDQANRTGNYSVLRALGTPAFQARNSAADLAVIFSGLRRNKIDLSEAALRVPRWQHPPRPASDGLRLRGLMGLGKREIFFDLHFKARAGMWRMFAVRVEAKHPPSATPPGSPRKAFDAQQVRFERADPRGS